ncbi:hypothetical protein CC1G_05980 [Coprinopsis cinerea okayama7|uniref:Uncharacterized protein n=1 Tax=Coprinopsis cinerea (strain Okayama-7 / 130 / ATCC MYA-4618 / FGSC 9003) TaxID=240176 RepID=A8N4K2_COPC7|nr:hypothetical protein CC1G_05980 [Coprinopsis cinerea okayama7\|eukprot:XP_001829771.1 hypothetical protein CC1G_05980 [Coprinopsis cinerea okayama7\
MDFLKTALDTASKNNKKDEQKPSGSGLQTGNPLADGLLGKLNGALGGGPEAEKKEDMLDKAIDLFQEHVLKEGPQNNESAIEQAKDKMIADTIRSQFKSVTGKEFPIKPKQ